MTSARILEVFGVVQPRPDQTAMAEYLADCEQAIQALSDEPNLGKEKRKRLGLAVLQQVEEMHQREPENHIDGTPNDLLLEAKWRVESNNV